MDMVALFIMDGVMGIKMLVDKMMDKDKKC